MDLIWASLCHPYIGHNSLFPPAISSLQNNMQWGSIKVNIESCIIVARGDIRWELYETIRAVEYNPFDIWNMFPVQWTP